MRDWLTIIIVLLIVGILLDGIRRMRNAKRESIQLSKNAKKADSENTSESSSEFPSGGARIAGYRDPERASNVNENLRKTYLSKKTTVGAPNRIPEQVTLNLDEHVPMLMDSIEAPAKESQPTAIVEEEIEQFQEPSLGDLSGIDDSESLVIGEPASDNEANDSGGAEEEYQQPDEVMIINVMAKSGQRFDGEQLLNTLVDQGMKLGAMDIFHRHRNDDGDGAVLFSLANMVVPGTFNLAQMGDFQTPGVSLFLSLPLAVTEGQGDLSDGMSIRAYDNMAATAKAIAAGMGGELKDENRSVMTHQTIEHDRQRVVEYERKQHLNRV